MNGEWRKVRDKGDRDKEDKDKDRDAANDRDKDTCSGMVRAWSGCCARRKIDDKDNQDMLVGTLQPRKASLTPHIGDVVIIISLVGASLSSPRRRQEPSNLWRARGLAARGLR